MKRTFEWGPLIASMIALTTPAGAAPSTDSTEGPVDTMYVMPRVEVIGPAARLRRIPGSGAILDARTLEASHVLTPNEALRKMPGLNVRDEEGFGLRPNIGIRGLNPTRSTKVTLLEDGIPLAYAPYGDNASYYHPPIERFQSIELLKGAGQILFGPQTIGGVVNYITPVPPARFGGLVSTARGDREYSLSRARLGARRALVDYTHKSGDGARDNLRSELDDVNLKAVATPALVVRANYFRERSTVTYSGLTQAEFKNLGARYNPFRNDNFDIDRSGGSATHRLAIGTSAYLTTSLYVSHFQRDWWRQSSTTTDAQGGPGVAAARLAGQPIDADTILSVQGRLRKYTTWGLEPRFSKTYSLAGAQGEFWVGGRGHFEEQDRRQVNGATPTAREGSVAENNYRRTRAGAAFVASRLAGDRWSVAPGLRYERIRSSRANRLTGAPEASDDLGKWIPSLGATWRSGASMVLFGGVHVGFAPPRVEDVIAGNGTATEVKPEESVNWELGARMEPSAATELQITAFRNEFRRLIAVGSIAAGSTPLAEGEALFMGAEFSAQFRRSTGPYLRGAWTWLPEAEQTTPFRQVVGGAAISGSVAGRRQPYAPKNAFTLSAGYAWRGLDGLVEIVHVGSQFADFANTEAPTADGQRGRIGSETVWNATLNHTIHGTGATAFISVKNLTDRSYIVDRTRGIQTGAPRSVQAGLTFAFGDGR